MLDIQYVVNGSANETSLLSIWAMAIPRNVRDRCKHVLQDKYGPLISWAHFNEEPPSDFDAENRRRIGKKLAFWKLVNKCVNTRDPFSSLKLFKHGAQWSYAKPKEVLT